MMPKFHKLIIFFILIFSIQEKVNAQAPNCIWAKSFGGTSNDATGGMTIDALGNVYSCGYFKGTVDFDPSAGIYNLTPAGTYGLFITKFDTFGNLIWAKTIAGGPYLHEAMSITLDNFGNIYTTGNFYGTGDFDPGASTFDLTSAGTYCDVFISKLDNSGNFIWAKQIGGPFPEEASTIKIDPSGNIYIAGMFYTFYPVDFDPEVGTFYLTSTGYRDGFLTKLDNLGNFLWAKQLAGYYEADPADIAFDASENIYVTGAFTGVTDFDPSPATFTLIGGVDDIFVLKLSSLGSFIWAKAMGGAGPFEGGFSIAVDSSNNVYTAGRFRGTGDFDPGVGTYNLTAPPGMDNSFISKLDSLGDFVWAKSTSGAGNNFCTSIILDNSSNIYLTGAFEGLTDLDPGPGIFNLSSTGYMDIFISKLTNSGNLLWTKAMGGPTISYNSGNNLAIDNYGKIYLTGMFSSPVIPLDCGALINTDTMGFRSDVFIVKFNDTLTQTVVLGGGTVLTETFVLTDIENQENDNSISLYPNPATDIFTVSFEKNIKKIELSILDITGKIIYTTIESSTQQIEVNTKDFSSGIYFVQIISSDFVETRKLVVAK